MHHIARYGRTKRGPVSHSECQGDAIYCRENIKKIQIFLLWKTAIVTCILAVDAIVVAFFFSSKKILKDAMGSHFFNFSVTN